MIRLLLWFIPAIFVFWLVGLQHFVHTMPKTPVGDSVSTDAIVVLTGGSLRIAYGFELLDKGKAQRLFITGVDDKADIQQLMALHGASKRVKKAAADGEVVILDHVADSTRTNAVQTAKWAAEQNIRSIRLVTANYHLPRSMIVFKKHMPDVVMIPDPVFPENFHLKGWWKDRISRELVLSEFHKYLAVWVWAVLAS